MKPRSRFWQMHVNIVREYVVCASWRITRSGRGLKVCANRHIRQLRAVSIYRDCAASPKLSVGAAAILAAVPPLSVRRRQVGFTRRELQSLTTGLDTGGSSRVGASQLSELTNKLFRSFLTAFLRGGGCV